MSVEVEVDGQLVEVNVLALVDEVRQIAERLRLIEVRLEAQELDTCARS